MSAGAVLTMLRTALKLGFASSPDDAVLAGLLCPYSTEVGKLSLIRNAAALNTNLTTELTPLLSSIRVPTLILWGEDDRFQPVKYGERLARDIPGAELVRIPDARHFVMFDRPDEIQRHVAAFV
jgi:pimeloyl-ACP methyl ester carboxylesterase